MIRSLLLMRTLARRRLACRTPRRPDAAPPTPWSAPRHLSLSLYVYIYIYMFILYNIITILYYTITITILYYTVL